MSLLDLVKNEVIEILEWTDDTRDTLSYRFPDEDKAIKNGAQLIVRESQAAQMVYLGEFGETFAPGNHRLATQNLPVLTRLKSWKFGFDSPFKVDVYFLSTRLFAGNPWGTSNPVMLRDDDFGVVRARAFGVYDFRIVDARVFLREVAGSDRDFRLSEFAAAMRSRLVSAFSEALASSRIPLLDAATRYAEIGSALLPLINPPMRARYGIEIASFVVENISVPAEVERALDGKSSMAAIGNLDAYVKYQLAQGLATGGGAGAAGVAPGLVLGLAAARDVMPPARSAPADERARPETEHAPAPAAVTDIFTPAEIAGMLRTSEADVLSLIEAGELRAKRIGSALRVTRAALDTYLGG